MTGGDEAKRAIRACQHAGLRVVIAGDCTCGLRGRLVVLALPQGLRVVWPYEERCAIHGLVGCAGSVPAKQQMSSSWEV
jgi:hypothetical protein